MAPRKSTTTKDKPAAKTTKAKKPSQSEIAQQKRDEALKPKKASAPADKKPPVRFNTPVDEENKKLFLGVHLPEIKKLREKLASANANLRNAYKTAKAEGGFTKTDFDTAIQLEDAEKEAKTRARIARQLVIARYMGSALGAQLDMFLEPDRTPASDIAFSEGERAAMQGETARPDYDPSTEQYRRYMEGYHSVSEKRVTEGIKTKPGLDEQAEHDAEADEQHAANEAQRAEDAEAFEEPSIPNSRAQFLKQQQREKEQAESSFALKH